MKNSHQHYAADRILKSLAMLHSSAPSRVEALQSDVRRELPFPSGSLRALRARVDGRGWASFAREARIYCEAFGFAEPREVAE